MDPLQLTEEATLNGTVLGDLPGANPAWVDRSAYSLLSSGVRASSEAEWRVFARALGHLIATLKAGGGAPIYAARSAGSPGPPSAWRAAYMRYWSTVEQVWLAGGVAAAMGASILDDVRQEVARLGVHGCGVEVTHHADILALIGAARSRHEPPPQALVLDFGHTNVKSGVAVANSGEVRALALLPWRAADTLATDADPMAVAEFVVDSVADAYDAATRRFVGQPIDALITVSLASYVVDGVPCSSRGIYGRLARVERADLEAQLSRRIKASIRLKFMHDGTAAASGLDGPHNAAVIVLGTSLAAGFPAPADRLAPLAADFSITR